MYRLDTHQARTDLFEIGKGAAQVIDLSPLRNNLTREEAKKERDRLLKQKEQQDRQDDIEAQLAKNNGISYMSHDQPLIAEQTQAVRDYTLKNIDKLRNGDINAKLGFDQVLGVLNNTYAMSHDKRQKWEQTNQLLAANPDKYRPDSIEKQMEYSGSKNAGDFTYNPANYLKENFDTQKYIKDTVRPIAEDIASKGSYDYVDPETGSKITYTKDNLTPAESEKLFHNTVLKNQKAYEQASYDLSQDPEAQKKYGHDVNSYLKDQYFDQFLIKRDKTSQTIPHESEWQYKERTGAIPEKDKTNVTSTLTDNGHDITLARNNENNEKMLAPVSLGNNKTVNVNQVHFHKDNAGYIQAYATVPLTKDEQTENTKVIAENIQNGTEEPLPFQEKTIRISKQQANEVIHNNYKGIDNVEDLYKQKYNEGQVNFQHNDYQTKKSPQGKEKLFIVNGKAYKESALKKQGYDISTLEEYK